MKKETIIIRSILGGVAIVATAGLFSNYLASQAEPPAKRSSAPTKGVLVERANPSTTPFQLQVYGKIEAYERIELFAEVSGVLQSTNPPFLEGNAFRKGQTLLRIEDSEATASLMSQRSTYINTLTQVLPDIKLDYPDLFEAWQNYLASIDLDKNTPAPPAVDNSQAKIFLTSKGVYSAYHNLKSSEERLDKYHIRAPFSGVVTQSSIRPGTLVRIGQPMGTFINPSVFELEVSLSLQYLDLLQEGNKVMLSSPDIDGEWEGTINRINKGLDANSQTVKAYIRLKGSTLCEGMYLSGVLQGVNLKDVVSVNRRLIFDNNHLWTVEDSSLVKRRVEVVEFTENEALVRGLNAGELLVTEPVPGAFTGMPVTYSEEL